MINQFKRIKINILTIYLKACFVFIVLIVVTQLSACGKKIEKTNPPIQELTTTYVADNLISYTVGEDGIVYIVDYNEEKKNYEIQSYDTKGDRLENFQLPCDSSAVECLAVSRKQNKLYFTCQYDSEVISLLSMDISSKSINKICDFKYFNSIKQIELIDNRLYILGIRSQANVVDDHVLIDGYQGQQLVFVDLESAEVYQIDIDKPISMAVNEERTLVIQAYKKSLGYCLFEFNPKDNSLTELQKLSKYKFDTFAICNQGKSVIYSYPENSRGLVLSEFTDLDVETELYEDEMLSHVIKYVNNMVYCLAVGRNVVSFPLDQVQTKNKAIRFISSEYGMLKAPYGCGYSMKRMEMDLEKFTLKVLAQDKDYDLCIVDSFYRGSRNIRNNAVFYPLNEIPGINEYLDRCFPYVKESATKEDGTIWMLPVRVDIPSVVISEEAKNLGCSLKNNMNYDEFLDLVVGLSEENQQKIGVNQANLELCFFLQYFNHYTTLDRTLFQDIYKVMKRYNELPVTNTTDDLMKFTRNSDFYNILSRNLKASAQSGSVYSVPKISATDKNTGTCEFLAVNPKSSNLKQTLHYIQDYIAYCMAEKELPLFFTDTEAYRDSFGTSLYDLYQNGEITFAIDSDVYGYGFSNVISGDVSLEDYLSEAERRINTYFNE